MKTRLLPLLAALALGLLLNGCNYDVALTEKPTRPVDARLLGEWLGGENGKDLMVVRALDDSNYVVALGNDLYRAFHSDFQARNFLSVQCLQPGSDYHRYLVMSWELSADDKRLTLHTINPKVVPEGIKTSAELQKIFGAKLGDPHLFNEPVVFNRKP